LTLQHHHRADVDVISVGGELDLLTGGRLEECIRRVYRPGTQLIFDLAETGFVDCSGLRALIRAQHLARSSGGVVRLAALRRGPAKVVALADVGAWLPVHVSLEQAIKAATQSADGALTRRRTRLGDRYLLETDSGAGGTPVSPRGGRFRIPMSHDQSGAGGSHHEEADVVAHQPIARADAVCDLSDELMREIFAVSLTLHTSLSRAAGDPATVSAHAAIARLDQTIKELRETSFEYQIRTNGYLSGRAIPDHDASGAQSA